MAERYVEEVCICGDGSPSDRIGDLRIRIRELPMADGVYASTGCQLWSASVALAQELARRQSLVAGRSVIEVVAMSGGRATDSSRSWSPRDGHLDADTFGFVFFVNLEPALVWGPQLAARRLDIRSMLSDSGLSLARASVGIDPSVELWPNLAEVG